MDDIQMHGVIARFESMTKVELLAHLGDQPTTYNTYLYVNLHGELARIELPDAPHSRPADEYEGIGLVRRLL